MDFSARVSKYRVYYGEVRDKELKGPFITERSLFYEDLDKIIEQAEKTLAHWGQKYQQEKSWGYQCHDEIKHLKLQLLRDAMLEHRMQIQYNVVPCLIPLHIQKAIEEANRLIIMNCCSNSKSSLVKGENNKDGWLERNPYCVAREKWEALAYKICGDIKIKVSVKDVACDLAYIITSEEVDCSLQYAIESNKKNCEIEFNVTEEEWNSKVKNTKYIDGKRLARCGISFGHIIGMDKCGITTTYNEARKCPQIEYENKKVLLSQLNIEEGFSAENTCNYLRSL